MGTYENIKGRLKCAENLVEGGFALDNALAVAREIDMIRAMEIEFLPNRFFPTLASGEDLTLAAENFGVQRKQAIGAEVTLEIKGAPDTQCSGVKAVSDSGLIFAVEAFTIQEDGTAAVKAVCETRGEISNVEQETICAFTTQYAGVQTVTNPKAAYGGRDEESDDDLLQRVKQRWQAPSTGGNAADYMNWALAVSGVARARAFNPQAGFVEVAVISVGNEEADVELLEAVQEALDEKKPLGASVSAFSAQAAIVDVSLLPLIEDGYSEADVLNRMSHTLQEYFAKIAFETDIISYAKLLNMLFVEGVADVQNCLLTIRNAADLQEAGGVQIPLEPVGKSVELGSRHFPKLGVISFVA